jgi:hypothetical protein
MSILQGIGDVNTDHLDKLIGQISHLENASCAQINLVVNTALGSVKGLISGMIKEIASLTPLTGLMNLPFPDPVSIVKWLADLVTGLIGTQLQALIKYAKKLITLSIKLGELAAAIQGILPAIAACAVNSLDPSTILNDLRAEVDSSIAASFEGINKLTTSLSTVSTVFTTSFDTSSPEAFLATVDEKYETISTQLKSYSG